MQSVIPAEEKEVTYTEFLPCKALRPFIYCYWELKSPPRNTPFCYRVVADGCIDLFFDCNAPQISSLMGYCNTYVEFPIMGAFHYIGVRFLPSVFPLLFGQDAFEISAQEIPLREVVPLLATFIAQQSSVVLFMTCVVLAMLVIVWILTVRPTSQALDNEYAQASETQVIELDAINTVATMKMTGSATSTFGKSRET